MKSVTRKYALVGNPNTGKTSIFNRLTGLNQHVGNFPGVTVDRKIGKFSHEGVQIEIIDLPGTYSVYPRSADEQVVYTILNDPKNLDFPDGVVVVVDASNLERNLLLFTQVYDLGIPCVLVLNMSDIAARDKKVIQKEVFQKRFPGVELIETNARVGLGIERLKAQLSKGIDTYTVQPVVENYELVAIEAVQEQEQESNKRFQFIRNFVQEFVQEKEKTQVKVHTLDKILVHPVFGYAIFAAVLLVMFQLIFSIASYPMDWIDGFVAFVGDKATSVLPSGVFSDLITQGVIPGIGGVIIFVPQIALLFLCIGILEETGYMARVVFIMDRLMRPFGLNGKSVVPLLSSAACAIPGVMATRTISNWKERLITIMTAPLMSCSARIPVYTLLIALVIPNIKVFGFISVQGLTLFALYALGLISALLVSALMKWLVKSNEVSVLMLELPEYRSPRWGNVFLNLYEKISVFVIDAGKVILAVSIILWALASYGPGDRIDKALAQIELKKDANEAELSLYEERVAAVKLENSYMGILGKSIEPVIKPLGYDWKIGISLLTSFAAREVFVGSMATIYSVHQEDDDTRGLLQKMRSEKRVDGTAVYSLATGLSLMVFYVYAMQCMATLAIVKRETKSWKWPLIQIGYMGVLAYLASLLVYNLFS
jgi:ferrous iron transport protein B